MLDQPSISTHPDLVVKERYSAALKCMEKMELSKAKELLEYNIGKDCSDSMVLLGTILADGTDDDKKRSIELFRMADEKGNSSGTRNLAYCYAIGLNIERDKEKGAELYTKAARMGNARAACNIGVMSDYGNGVQQDFNMAFHWYTLSAEGGYPRGMTNLGEYYLHGKGTEKNVDIAIKLFERSSSPRALNRLYVIYSEEEGYIDQEKADRYLRLSAEAGYSKSMYKLALQIFDTDRDKAVEYLRKAAKRRNKEAAAFLEEHVIQL